MGVSGISFSYIFLGIALISISFYLYFRLIYTESANYNSESSHIIGKMKDPENWRTKNNYMSYISLFWAIVSFSIFVALKFFFQISIISLAFLFIYIALIAVSAIYIVLKFKDKKSVG